MKLAVISDIHGNHYALEEVLKIAFKENVKKLLFLGDLVGYYYHSEKVIKLISEWDCHLIKGNHEKILVDLANGFIQEEDVKKKYGSGHQLALEKLSKEEIAFITSAPDQLKVIVNETSFLLCHGAPFDNNYYLYPDTEKSVLVNCDRENIDFVLVGHSHYPFVYRNLHSMLLNVGSVGQSRIMGGVANWAIINTENKSFEMKATPYNTSALEKEVDLIDPDNLYMKDILKRNRY